MGVGGSLPDNRSELRVMKGSKKMKKLKWPVTKEQSDYMRERQEQNRARNVKAEDWFLKEYLDPAQIHMTRQAAWGYRLFDFWNHSKGVAIEIDGPTHDPKYDEYRDRYNFLRSGIIVLRVKNYDASEATSAIEKFRAECTWHQRRKAMGLLCKETRKKDRRILADAGELAPALLKLSEAGLFCSYAE